MSQKIRDVSPILQIFRNFLLGRKHTLALRFQKDLASRSPPLPELPDGPAHKINSNHYFARDVRREVTPPELIADSTKRLSPCATPEPPKGLIRRNVYHWD